MLIIAFEIIIFAILGIGLIVALIFCNSVYSSKSYNSEKKRIEFLPTSINEEFMVQNALMAYYEQQRNELIERQKVALDASTVDMTVLKTNESGYASVHSPSHTPHSLYECTGFASMVNLEVSNPLFSTDILYDNEQLSVTSFSSTH